MPKNATITIQRAAAVLRNMLNVCGDDRKCQCEQAVEISEETMRVALSDALTIDGLSQIIRTVDGNHDMGAGQLAEAIHAAILGES